MKRIRAVVIKGNGKGFSAGADLGGDVTEMVAERMDDISPKTTEPFADGL